MHSNRFFSTLSIALSFFLPVYGAFYTDPARLPTHSFDYVVVGGGTAGAVIANRLTENPRVTVLLLEAGPSNINVTNSIVPLLHNFLIPNTPYDWNFTTTNQVGFNGRNISFPRGHMLGGSSSVNGLVFTRGSSDDWDAYAAIAEDPSWTWENIQRYLPLIEQFTEPIEPYNTTGDFVPSLHGTDGKLQTSVANYRIPLDDHIIEASQELGDEFPLNPDMGGGENVLGLGWTVSTIGRGVRSSSATAYLAPEYLSRPNLHVLVHAQVTKLVQTGTRNRLPSFHSLQFTSTLAGPGARPITVTGRRAVVLSAGAVGTPHILQLSGIGDRSLLESVGIRTIVHNPSVGRNLSDHPLLACVYSVHDNSSYDILFREPAVFQAAMDQWNANHTGPGAASVFNQVGFFRLPDNATIFETTPDPASGPKSGHFEIMFSNFYNLPGLDAPTSGTTISFDVAVIPATSRGSVELTSTDPFAAPAIDPAYLQSEFDIFTMLEAVKAVRRFAQAQTFDGYIIEPFGEFGAATTDELLEAFARGNAATVFHPVGTSSMSPKGANWGVVDPDLRVKGVEGLFIIDAGVINKLPTAHTMAPTFIVAERGAELLKALT